MPVLLDHTYTNLINDQEGDVQFRSSQTCKKFTLIHRIHKSSFQKTRMIADAVHFPTKKKKGSIQCAGNHRNAFRGRVILLSH
jgi:hypothetical protein